MSCRMATSCCSDSTFRTVYGIAAGVFVIYDTVMVRRLILLLIFALAVPSAVAMPACAADPSIERVQPQQHHTPQKKQERNRPSAETQCLGCVAPSTTNPPMLEAPVPGLLLIPAAYDLTGIAGRSAGPATPPPKLLG